MTPATLMPAGGKALQIRISCYATFISVEEVMAATITWLGIL